MKNFWNAKYELETLKFWINQVKNAKQNAKLKKKCIFFILGNNRKSKEESNGEDFIPINETIINELNNEYQKINYLIFNMGLVNMDEESLKEEKVDKKCEEMLNILEGVDLSEETEKTGGKTGKHKKCTIYWVF